MKSKIIVLFAAFMTITMSVQEKWSLRQCIDYAIEHNIEIKQQSLQVEGAKIDLSTSKNSRLPNLNADLGANANFGMSTMRDNTNGSFNTFNSSAGVSTSVPVFTGFRITNEIKSKEFDLLSATANLSKARENLELQVTSLYLEVLFKKEIEKIYIEQLGLTSNQLEKTKALVESGKVPRSQEYDMLSQHAKDELNLTMSRNDLDISLLNLSQALNLTEDNKIDVVEPKIDKNEIENNKASIIPPSEIYQTAIGIKPHVKVAEYDLESSKSKLKIAKAAYYPTVSFQMGYNTSYSNVFSKIKDAQGQSVSYPNESFSSQLRNQSREYIGLSVSIPVFNRFQTRNNVRSARLNIENSELVLDNVKLALYKEIQQAFQSATAAQAKFTSTEKAFQAAEESYKYAEQRYEIGKLSVFEFNEAQTKLLTSKSEQIQAKYDFVFRAKILDFYREVKIDIQ